MLRHRDRRSSFACLLGVLLSTWALHDARGDDFEYLSEPAAVYSIDMTALLKSKLSQRVAELPGFDKTAMASLFRGGLGIPHENVARITGSGIPSYNGEAIVVVKTAKAISANDIKAASTPGVKDIYFERQIGSHTIYYKESHPFGVGLDARIPFCAVSDRVVLIGSVKAIETSLLRKKKPEFGRNVQEGLDQVGFANTIMMVVDLQTVVPSIKKVAKEPRWLLDASDHFGTLTVRVNLGEANNKISATMFCKDAAGAAAVRKCAEDGLALWQATVKRNPQDAPSVKEANKALRAFADAVKISTKGSRVDAEATLDMPTAVSVMTGLLGVVSTAPGKEK